MPPAATASPKPPRKLGIDGNDIVVNVQGDEPMIEPALIDACAALLGASDDCVMSTAAHPIRCDADFDSENIVKVVIDARRTRALLLARADPLAARRRDRAMPRASRRRCATSASTPIEPASCAASRARRRARSKTSNGSSNCACCGMASGSPCTSSDGDAGIGIDTPADLERARALFAARDGAGFA